MQSRLAENMKLRTVALHIGRGMHLGPPRSCQLPTTERMKWHTIREKTLTNASKPYDYFRPGLKTSDIGSNVRKLLQDSNTLPMVVPRHVGRVHRSLGSHTVNEVLIVTGYAPHTWQRVWA